MTTAAPSVSLPTMKLFILSFILLVAGLAPASAQLLAPPYALTEQNAQVYINVTAIIDRAINNGYIPYTPVEAETLGFMHGCIESNSEFFGSPDYDGQEVAYYDTIPYEPASFDHYMTLYRGYLVEGYTAGQYGQAWLYDAGFYHAMAYAIAVHFNLPLPTE